MRSEFESEITAVIYMSLSPAVLLASLEIIVSRIYGLNPIFELLGKWMYSTLLFSMVCLAMYLLLARGNKTNKIIAEFNMTTLFDRTGNYIVSSYFAFPFLFMLFVAGKQ